MKTRLNNYIRQPLKVIALILLASSLLQTDLFAREKPGQGQSITPRFGPILPERFRGEVALIGLRELGYKIEPTQLSKSYDDLLNAISNNEADFTTHHWDVLHKQFYADAGGDSTLKTLGTIIPNVLQGYLIDKKTAREFNISSINDLKRPEIARLFDTNGDGKADLAGCDAGWGCNKVIAHHMKSYDLSGSVNNNTGPYFELITDVIERYKEGEPILYYTWIPHWISALLVPGRDVVFLEAPFTSLPGGDNSLNTSVNNKNIGFAVDGVMSIMNRESAGKHKAAAKFLSLLTISTDDENQQALKIRNGEKTLKDIKRHASDWVFANQDQFNQWLDEASKEN